jgi:ketosteroid isomerase-like protein
MTSRTAKDSFIDLFATLETEDEEAARRLIAPDAVWRFPGRMGRLSGEGGPDDILAFL